MEHLNGTASIPSSHTEAFLQNGIFCQDGLLSSLGVAAVGSNFFVTWAAFTLITIVIVFLTSGPLFYFYYWPTKVTYEKWVMKSNPKFPSPEKVRDEIVQMTKSVITAAMCPAASVYLAYHGKGQAYCGSGGYGVTRHVIAFAGVMIASDFWEFFYHYLGHKYKAFWENHKAHHVFHNPSPFAVIADEFIDQFVRAAPLLLFPLLVPLNIDLLFFEFGVFFYTYGCYLHWGYELDWPDAHHPIINTSFQHYCHHAKAMVFKPYHCGFFFKIWDNLFGSVYDKECFCVKCERAKGGRTEADFKKVVIPDYNRLLEPSFWFQSGVLSGTTSKEDPFWKKKDTAKAQ